ncbi:FAD-dependent oxidoreductase (plasmid) [Rhodococcus sp. ZPP]|uniref:FAD-dependent oxidoreductase n=1 Tax=Rhodococcus sp. ZPP TaxID=2749906 RepID=UPI001AD86ADB|nr:FAD-dependent oxidoreductase [Rhodococcus sp. ZPP]QTJ70814.1 FAD-dependent oxidoreductase [Rhodococcus sp. ZPP]
MRPIARISIIGAGPAGIYVADALAKSDVPVSIDIFDRHPAPYGLIRYGVAPDHPRIKNIVKALHEVLELPQVRFLGNVQYGVAIDLADLQHRYDAVVFATGANKDRDLDIPGIGLTGSFGGAEFASWYDSSPDAPLDWTLAAESIAVIGAGNVALDVARMLSKTADEFLSTEIADNVYRALRLSPVREVHLFARRGPAQAKFTPLELRELGESPNVEVIVDPADIKYDEASLAAKEQNSQIRMVTRELEKYATKPRDDRRPRKLYLHFFENPVEVIGTERVVALRTERTQYVGDGETAGSGVHTQWPVQAVYRCIGYRSTTLPGLPWDNNGAVVPHIAGRVIDHHGGALPGIYVNGWIKRGPVGLIGRTRSDAAETVKSLLEDLAVLPRAVDREPNSIDALLLSRHVQYTTWSGWLRLDAHERELGAQCHRERVKMVDRAAMIAISGVDQDSVWGLTTGNLSVIGCSASDGGSRDPACTSSIEAIIGDPR